VCLGADNDINKDNDITRKDHPPTSQVCAFVMFMKFTAGN
jgi:hypothetical protein